MATRLGFYTGKLYDENVSTAEIHECAQVLYEPTEALVDALRPKLRAKCIFCNACEEARKGAAV